MAFTSRWLWLLGSVVLLAGVGSACDAIAETTPTATLLFKSNFGPGVTLSAPQGFYTTPNGGGAWQSLTGTDRETGYTWPVSALSADFSGVQLITIDSVDATTIGNHIVSEIRTVPGPTGSPVHELFQTVKIKAPVGKGKAQAPLLIKRPWTMGDVTDLYLTYWFKHQADLRTQLDNTVSAGNWRSQFEFKTGGYHDTYGGDYRIITNVMKDTTDGTLFWKTNGDNQANGPYDASKKVVYWTVENRGVPVPVDQWFKFEVYWHRSSGTDGRYWAAVNGQVIADHHGPNMGDFGLPINRIMIDTSYSGGHTPVESQMTGLEIWDGFPCGDGVSCYHGASGR